jgi:hypothetical protein
VPERIAWRPVNTGWSAGLTDAQGKSAKDVTVWLAPQE